MPVNERHTSFVNTAITGYKTAKLLTSPKTDQYQPEALHYYIRGESLNSFFISWDETKKIGNGYLTEKRSSKICELRKWKADKWEPYVEDDL